MDKEGKSALSLDKKAVKIGLLVGVVLFAAILVYGVSGIINSHEPAPSQLSLMVPVSINDVYPLFMCPCCGKPLDPESPCCGLAKERIDYISALSDSGISNEEIVLTTVKKYGINLLIDESLKDEVRKELGRRAPADRPKISIEPALHDFGNVSFAAGAVSTTMTIKNNGGSDLVINELDSSCGCTSATISKDGVEGPVFGMKMHGKNPVDWSINIKPGETAQLNIYYDPTVHPDLRGPVTRSVSIFSNDPIEFKKEVRIEVNQVD
ncbi:hypothetical protein BMS3Abin16_01107 [archaeon BMS3Abin16]|nr:hypothetical protein BMS3Abin16_01107 [archaeon BMS3Abin16]HDY74792.1 DUF1573 domain-containing protein [Euryarchaeota archaeon]